MKKFYFVAVLTALMTLVAPCAWGEEWKLTYSDINTSYNSGNTISKTKEGINYSSVYVMQYSKNIQFKKNSGYLYNTTPMPGNITKITLATTTNFSIYVGDAQQPSSGTPVTSGNIISGDYTYFYIKASGSNAATTATITVEYEVCSTKRNVEISANPIDGGTVNASSISVCPNKKIALSYTENNGYYFDSWSVMNNATTDFITVVKDSFIMPDADVTVEGSFKSCTPLPNPNLTSSDVEYNSFNIQWGEVTGATKYQISITDDGTTQTYTTTSTSYSFTGLTEKTNYIIKVKAIGDNHRYCDSDEAEIRVTTPARNQYTITWSTPDNSIAPTTILEDDALVLPTTTPAAPGGCLDKVFVGWSATNIGSIPMSTAPDFVSSSTIPTASTTYYAVFADKNGSGTSHSWTSYSDWGVQENSWLRNNNATLPTFTYTPTYKVEKIVLSVSQSNTTGSQTIEATIGGVPFGELITSISSTSADAPCDITFQGTTALSGEIKIICTNKSANKSSQGTLFVKSITLYESAFSDYVTQCADCTTPQSPFSFIVNATTANLGEDGTVAVGFSYAEGNGSEPSYTITPTTGCTINGNQLVFSAAGTYTITARQDLATVGGVTYCGDKASQTITITKNPVFGTATIDKNTFEVECGDTTSMTSAATITFGTNYNLTKDITITAPDGFLVSTNKTDNSKYLSSVTLTPTASGENAGKITGKVYVRAYSKTQNTDPYSGNITISGTEITTQDIAVSSTVTCQEYALQLNDRGSVTNAGNYYAGASVTAPTDPIGVCTDPINYVFDGWSTTEVTDGATSYTKVDFSKYTMPKGGATLYAVYKYAADGSSSPQKISAENIVDGGKYYITASYSGTEYILKAGKFTSGNSNENTATFDANAVTESVAWTFVKSGNNWSIKSGDYSLGTENKSNGLYSKESNTQTWSCAKSTGTFVYLKNIETNRYLALYNGTNWRAYAGTTSGVPDIQLYSATAYSFTSTPACGVYITGTKGIKVTSAKDIWVEATDTFVVSATNLDKNADGGNVSISAEVVSGNFALKTVGKAGSGSKSKITLATDYSDPTFTQKLIVVYKPTADNTTETGQFLLRVYKANGSTEYATATIDIQGRSLPARFVIAAKATDGWVALPSDLSSSESAVKAPYAITVDNLTNPTKATQAPSTAIYKGAARDAVNTCANAIRLQSDGNNAFLQASTAKSDGTGIWLSTTNSDEAQSWHLVSSDLVDYTARIEKAEAGRYLTYNATYNKIANYKATGTLRFLPVETTCTRFDAPSIKTTTAASSQVTLTWAEITGATAYEYSTDQTSWSSGNLTISTASGTTTAIISGLTATTSYTLYIRVKVTSDTNCSDIATATFTTTDCDDVPTNISAYASSNSVTISWTAQAATSTVKIYSDAAGTTEVASQTDAKSPCTLSGLKQNTKYYYQVFAGGSCGSTIDNFTTETSAISVVEWFQDSIIVNVNTEGSDVSVVIEGQKAHGDASNKNIANDLFFSKYFEAKSNLKLVAIYNGTTAPISLANTRILFSKGNEWESANETLDLSTLPDIPVNAEYIFFSYTESGKSGPAEGPSVDCVKSDIGFNHNNWFPTNEFTANDLGKTLQFSDPVNLNISGDRSMALQRKVGDTWKFIDLFGAGNETKAVNSTVVEITGQIEVTLEDGTTTTTKMNDAKGWYCADGTHYVTKNSIPLSTNRYLLIRKNTVKDGLTAVANNTADFTTLCSEWEGAPCGKFSDTEDDNKTTCVNFKYVADYDYSGYYTAYDSIGGLREIDGHQNPDGTYTIPVNRIDTFACKDIRLVVKDNGTEMVNKTQRVPIMVVANTDTKNDTLFHFSADTCKTCDVVVRDKAKLTHVNGGRHEFRDMYIYAGSYLELPAGESFSLQTTHMHAKNDLVSYAIINNDNTTISINKLVHVKRIDGHYWYPFSLPYDCKIADIVEQCGLDLGTYGTDWGIKYYDGQKRQSTATAAALGATGYHWYMMPADGTLKANHGYIIALAYPNENLMRSIYFTPAGNSNYLENGTEKNTYISNWSDNLSADPRHHGWNFVGSPYISLFGEGTDGQGLNNTQMKMGRTNTETGEQEDINNVYVSLPNGGNTNTYTQSIASGVTLYPFKAYFVQSIDPVAGASGSDNIMLTYTKTNTRLNAPARVQSTAKTIFAELTLANSDNTLHDNAGVLVSDQYTANYEIGSDLTKMYAADVRPQLYTNDASWGKMAYLAIADEAAHNISLGLYLPAAGTYTLSLNNNLSETASADAVYLLYNGEVVANLLTMDYTLNATAAGTVSGYSLDIRRAAHTTTADQWAEGEGPQAHYREGMLYIDNLSSGAEVYVYDVLGRLLLNTIASDTMVSMPTVTTGVYTILVRNAGSQTVLKTLLR